MDLFPGENRRRTVILCFVFLCSSCTCRLAFDQILVTSYPTIINDARGLALPRFSSPFPWFFLCQGHLDHFFLHPDYLLVLSGDNSEGFSILFLGELGILAHYLVSTSGAARQGIASSRKPHSASKLPISLIEIWVDVRVVVRPPSFVSWSFADPLGYRELRKASSWSQTCKLWGEG
ncbi:MAG: hypothetical protein JWM04_1563, partial [Verrucomicrobiales bacterium]|nr:hypothetical protein [Verrucomicrobiales bacterium]